MPNQEKLLDAVYTFQNIKRENGDKIIREGLGRHSLKQMLEPLMAQFDKLFAIFDNVNNQLNQEQIDSLQDDFEAINDKLNNIVNLKDPQYIERAREYANELYPSLYNIKSIIAPLVAYDLYGLDNESDVSNRKIELSNYLNKIEEEKNKLDSLLANSVAKSKQDIVDFFKEQEKRISKSARKISVELAQEQFDNAQASLYRRSLFWGIVSLVFVGALLYFLYDFYSNHGPQNDLEWQQVVYFTSLRVAFLIALGGLAAVSIRLFRAYLHMREQNLHRQRIANSMAAFVESAATDEQGDAILARLVDAVADFGTSGLLIREGRGDSSQIRAPLEVVAKSMPNKISQ